MWSPPHHSGLHPIELLWVNVKVNVGRQQTKNTALANVKSRLNSDFSTFNTNTLDGCIKKDNNILAEFMDQIMVMQVIEEDEDTTDNANDEIDNDSLGGQ